jgi:ribosomal protein S18 acetylase RimI-like enzyme
MKITYIKVKKINNPNLLADIVFNNFIYLKNIENLGHNKEEIIKTLNLPNNLDYLVYIDNKLIGYLIGDFRNLNSGRLIYYISYIYISKSYRGHKIGSQLLDLIINICKTKKIKYIVLTCDSEDNKIVRFYERYGFKVDEELDNNSRHNVYSLYLKN